MVEPHPDDGAVLPQKLHHVGHRAHGGQVGVLLEEGVVALFAPQGHHQFQGHALEALCRHLGLDLLDAAAFGDGTNDLTMIQRAGVGVAMENGAPLVREHADLIAPANTQDGVAAILSRWFPPVS